MSSCHGIRSAALHVWRAAVALLVLLGTADTRPARAQSVQISDVDFVQFLLIWTGDYSGMVDGVFGPQTERAAQSYFSRRIGRSPQTVSDSDIRTLVEDADRAMTQSGFNIRRDLVLGVTFGLPEAVLSPIARRNPLRLAFQSPDRAAELEVAYLRNEYNSLDRLYRKLTTVRGRTVTYSTFRQGWFVLSGQDGDRSFFARYHGQGRDIRGFAMSYPTARANEFDRVVVAMSNVFRPSAAANDALISFIEDLGKPKDNGGAAGPPTDRAGQPTSFSGSGFAISETAILTNAHVVESCKKIEVPGYGNTELLAFDPDYDLAVLRLLGRKLTTVAQIQLQSPELGQEVVILGYPLSDLMGDALSVTTGLISSLSGLGGDQGSYTLTANIQPGNSGGPVLDRNGNVIGVAVAKLDEAKMLQEAGTTGANIGFAISTKRLLDFLAPFRTSTTAYKRSEELSVQAITARARHFTVQILCRN